MVNWDLPWNPNRLEQRMGRIHRYGQEYEVQVANLVANTTREGEVLVRLMQKLESMREALGHDQVYDVISSVLEGGRVRLDTLIREAILKRRSMEDILADLEFVDSFSSVAAARDALSEALATSHIDMGPDSGRPAGVQRAPPHAGVRGTIFRRWFPLCRRTAVSRHRPRLEAGLRARRPPANPTLLQH